MSAGREKRNTMRPDAKVITIGELTEYLRVHRSTVYRLLKKGQLPGFRMGSDWRFNREDIDHWRLQQNAAPEGMTPAGIGSGRLRQDEDR
jgi:excisionase family DNA binding protein